VNCQRQCASRSDDIIFGVVDLNLESEPLNCYPCARSGPSQNRPQNPVTTNVDLFPPSKHLKQRPFAHRSPAPWLRSNHADPYPKTNSRRSHTLAPSLKRIAPPPPNRSTRFRSLKIEYFSLRHICTIGFVFSPAQWSAASGFVFSAHPMAGAIGFVFSKSSQPALRGFVAQNRLRNCYPCFEKCALCSPIQWLRSVEPHDWLRFFNPPTAPIIGFVAQNRPASNPFRKKRLFFVFHGHDSQFAW
jgi:hypothetical protein